MRKYVGKRAEGLNGTQAALEAYDTDDYGTAAVISTENLSKPKIIEALHQLGFDSNNAKRVVAEILNDETVEEQHRLRAAETVLKVNGEYAPEKVVYLNVEAKVNDAIKLLANGLLKRQRE
jgi:hypothetical protein